MNYQPSQPTGWQPQSMFSGPDGPGVGKTIGGHTAAIEFRHGGDQYRIGLLPFGQTGSKPNPVYAARPDDPAVNFRATLDDAFGESYAFTYTGGLTGQAAFSVESYSVFVNTPTETMPMLSYGTNLYFAYHPDPAHDHVRVQPNLQFIQVVNSTMGTRPGSEVDNAGRANPFFIWGGRTSIYGRPVINFNDTPQTASSAEDDRVLSDRFVAETFLVSDTGRRDRRGRGVVHVLGGVKYGWEVRAIS